MHFAHRRLRSSLDNAHHLREANPEVATYWGLITVNSKDWVVAAVAAFVGAVIGIGLIAISFVPSILGDKPALASLLGSLLGSFLAAMIGLGGAVWATLHTTAKQEAARRQDLASLASSLLMEIWLISVGAAASRIAAELASKGQVRHMLARFAAENMANRKMFERVQHDLGRLGPEFAVALPAYYDHAAMLASSIARLLQLPEGDHAIEPEMAKAMLLLSEQMDKACYDGAEILHRLSRFSSETPWTPERWLQAMQEGVTNAGNAVTELSAHFPTLWPQARA